MYMDIGVDREAGNMKLTHFIIESLGMTRIEHAVIEPDMGHFMKERIGQEGRVFPEIGKVEPDLVFEEVGEA